MLENNTVAPTAAVKKDNWLIYLNIVWLIVWFFGSEMMNYISYIAAIFPEDSPQRIISMGYISMIVIAIALIAPLCITIIDIVFTVKFFKAKQKLYILMAFLTFLSILILLYNWGGMMTPIF